MRKLLKVGGGTALLKAKPKRRASKAVRCLHLSGVKGFHDYARRIMRGGVRSFRALEIYVEDGARGPWNREPSILSWSTWKAWAPSPGWIRKNGESRFGVW